MQEAILNKKDGRIELSKDFDFMCSQLANGRYKLKIERYSEKRSMPQNALMWMWFACVENETGTDKQDVHDYYCSMFLKRESVVNGKEVTVIGGTSKLNTLQMTDFMNKVKADVAIEFGITLPLPEDMYYSEFVNEYKYR